MSASWLWRRFTAAWTFLWLRPVPPANLAACRIGFFGLLLLLTATVDWSDWAAVPDAFWFPIPITRALELPRAGQPALVALALAFRLSVLTSALGLFTRLSTVVALFTGAYLFWLPHNFGKIHHSDAVILFSLLILACSRCGDAISVDAWLRKRRGLGASAAPSFEYYWPVRLVQALTALMFFGAGISKLQKSGIDWAFSENLARLFVRHHYSHEPLVDWGLTLATMPLLTQALAFAALLLELVAPLALFHRRAALLIVPSLLALQVGNWLLLGVLMKLNLCLYLFFVPWDALITHARALWERRREFPVGGPDDDFGAS